MPPDESGTTAIESTTPVPLSTVFCANDTDVVIRAAGTRDFRAHKLVLSLVSPIFKDMFTVPQPPNDNTGTLPHVDVDESAETWENILRAIYHIPNSAIDNPDLDDLESLLLTAKKYEMQFIVDSHKKSFKNLAFIQQDPLRLYAIACACGLDDQAKYVARNAELVTIIRCSQGGDLRGASAASYHRLVTFLVERDNELHQILERGWASFNSYCNCLKEHERFLYEKTAQKLRTPYIQMEEVYLGALEDRLRCSRGECSGVTCRLAGSDIKHFLAWMLREREKVCDKFMWE